MKIRLLDSSFGNDSGDIVEIDQETEGELYYYDGFNRYVYVYKYEEGIGYEVLEDESNT